MISFEIYILFFGDYFYCQLLLLNNNKLKSRKSARYTLDVFVTLLLRHDNMIKLLSLSNFSPITDCKLMQGKY